MVAPFASTNVIFIDMEVRSYLQENKEFKELVRNSDEVIQRIALTFCFNQAFIPWKSAEVEGAVSGFLDKDQDMKPVAKQVQAIVIEALKQSQYDYDEARTRRVELIGSLPETTDTSRKWCLLL